MEAKQISQVQRRCRQKKWYKILIGFVLIAYLLMLFYFLFFAEMLGRTSVDTEYHYNLIPFHEIKRFIRYRKTLGPVAVTLNLFGNVVAFMPFGAMMPIFSKKCKNGMFTTFVSFELSLLVETIQLISKVGSFDVDDLMLNTLGGLMGYLCYYFVQRIRTNYYGKKKL